MTLANKMMRHLYSNRADADLREPSLKCGPGNHTVVSIWEPLTDLHYYNDAMRSRRKEAYQAHPSVTDLDYGVVQCMRGMSIASAGAFSYEITSDSAFFDMQFSQYIIVYPLYRKDAP